MQLELFQDDVKQVRIKKKEKINKLKEVDSPFHSWYRFVLSFPAHLVRDYLKKFNLVKGTLLDPFCGTGTTLVESKLLGIDSIGIEANPMAYFASDVKIDWSIEPEELLEHAFLVCKKAHKAIAEWNGILKTLPQESFKLLLKDSINPLPLHKALILLDVINDLKKDSLYKHELLAFSKMIVHYASNLYFGPEVGVRSNKKQDALVVESWFLIIENMANDLKFNKPRTMGNGIVYFADSREMGDFLKPESIDAVFTSPPYPNEKDYTRTTRLESILLGFIKNKTDLKNLKKGLLRSNTRNVYKGDDDDIWIADNREIQDIADAIETRRIELKKTSGFERMYSKVTKLYFGGMARHFASLRPFLKKGAYLGYVVGDQASYLRVMIRTGTLLAEIAKSLGYQVESIDLFRTRFSTVTKEQIKEEVLILRWPG